MSAILLQSTADSRSRPSTTTTATSRPKHRAPSDPFSDQSVPVRAHRPPDPPPKHSTKMSTATATRPRDNMMEAIRDTVTVTRDHSPRKLGRSQTALPPNTAPLPSARPPPSARQRSHSQDSVTQAAAAVERAKSKSGRPKKGSQHADVIDRLDFTGVGPMFHHDGPFDACAPSRNRHRNKAPMLAWSGRPQPDGSVPAPASNNDSPYPAPNTYKNTFTNNYYDPPKKKVDAIAEAWGTHEPEPFEDFSAGGGSGRPDGDTPNSSIYNGREGNRTRRTKDGREMREVYKEYLDEGQQAPRRAGTTKRPTLPPPQPIFVPDGNHPDLDPSPQSAPSMGAAPKDNAPKRNKSLMQRIRKMRDSPNMPVGDYDSAEQLPPSPTSVENNGPYVNSAYPSSSAARPTHRTQNSFLGRFGNPRDGVSPTAEHYDQGKELPATPYGYTSNTPTPVTEQDTLGYFDERIGGSSEYATSPNGQTPGRKNTILGRVKGVVRGGAK